MYLFSIKFNYDTEFQQQPLDGILHSNIDVDSWKLEVERVAPRLKITFEQDSKVYHKFHSQRID